jgi:hypothetical protein
MWYVFSLGAWDDPNEAQESFIGDESGTFGVSEVAGPPPAQPFPKMSDDEKKRFAHWSNYVGILGSASVFAGAIFAGTGNAAGVVVSAAIAAELGALAFVLNDIALDPIDNDYMEIAQPTPYPLPDVSPGGACAQRIGNGLSNTIGLAQALSTAYNRMQGAIAAGDNYWTQQQGQAMLGYAAKLDNRLATVDPAKIFGCLPQRQPRDASAVMSWETRLMRNGMPQYLTAAFAAIGITDPNDLASINGFFAVQDPALVSDGYNAIFGPRQSRPVYWQSLADNVP